MIDFLFVSNGYGEDAIAASIASRLSKDCKVAAFPLVGEGSSYARHGIPILRSFAPLPSAGVSISEDAQNGLFPLLIKQWKALKSVRNEVTAAVAVGDIVPCFLSRYALKRPFHFVGTAKSVMIQAYNVLEQMLIRKAETSFVRDQETAQFLNRRKVPSLWVGNPMMDEVEEVFIHFPDSPGRTIAVLPGSRADAPENFLLQVEALTAIAQSQAVPLRAFVGLPTTLSPNDFFNKLKNWDGAISEKPQKGLIGQAVQGNLLLLFTQDCLGDILRASSIVLGQAGTANEQAAGMGKPIVAFDFDGYRDGNLSWYRWRQKKLLEEALLVTIPRPDFLAQMVIEILNNRKLYDAMSDEGKKRMGSSGACQKIADTLREWKPRI